MRLTRRGMMKTAAAALAAPYIVPASARGAEGKPAPSRRVSIGMIGVGRQGTLANLRTFLSYDDVHIPVVCDVDAWRMENARKMVDDAYSKKGRAAEAKGCAACKDFREVLARPDVDAVMISTPDHWHVPMAIAAARAGKDVALEKPLTLCVAEGRALSDAMTRYGRVFRTDSEARSLGFFHKAAELVRNGRIGKLHTIRTGVPRGDVAGGNPAPMPVPEELDWPLWLGPAPEAAYTVDRVHEPRKLDRPGWMRIRDTCEGMITNWGTHINDIAQWGHNTERTGPVEVEGKGTYPATGLWNVLIDFEVAYRFADGVQMFYKMDRPYVRFEGSEGWIQADWTRNALSSQPESLAKSPTLPGEVHLPLKSEKRDFVDCVKTRGQTIADAEVGHRTTTLCQLGHIAIQVGRKLKWDPVAEQFPDDPEANRLLTRFMRAPWQL
ncbi:MAG: Gfo/Idh/MocA family oxidoreductase [Planctomycetes bacterium]|nr:Gfo/Idh/MocA family oxidoreductase [Planctomycetota bacterium]